MATKGSTFTFNKGMNRDLDKSVRTSDMYYNAENLRLISEGKDNTFSLESIIGNSEILSQLPLGEYIVGYCVVRDRLILFTTDEFEHVVKSYIEGSSSLEFECSGEMVGLTTTTTTTTAAPTTTTTPAGTTTAVGTTTAAGTTTTTTTTTVAPTTTTTTTTTPAPSIESNKYSLNLSGLSDEDSAEIDVTPDSMDTTTVQVDTGDGTGWFKFKHTFSSTNTGDFNLPIISFGSCDRFKQAEIVISDDDSIAGDCVITVTRMADPI